MYNSRCNVHVYGMQPSDNISTDECQLHCIFHWPLQNNCLEQFAVGPTFTLQFYNRLMSYAYGSYFLMRCNYNYIFLIIIIITVD